MADRAVLAGGVAALEDNQQRSSIFGVHQVLEVAELDGQLAESFLGLFAIEALWFQLGVDLVEID